MESEKNFKSITKCPLLKSVVGDTSINSRTTSIHDLSDYHIIEILVKLPVKTIVQCKCVCHDWLNLINDSHFINLHLTKPPECYMIIIDEYAMDPIDYLKPLKLVEIQDEHGRNHLHHNPITSLDLNFAPVFQYARLYPEGSVNGLICLSGSRDPRRDETYICNPITREYMILPKQINSTQGQIKNSYSFGVNSLTGEYKVIRVFQDIGLSITGPVCVEIYTLGTGQWRNLGQLTYHINEFGGKLLNNHFHYICDTEDPVESICTFDIDKETFQLFPSPPIVLEEDHVFAYYNRYSRLLGVLKGCLCYSCYSWIGCGFSIWVMKEYGIKNSWQKEVSINENTLPYQAWPFDVDLCPIGSLKDGSILMMFGSRALLVYHPDTGTIEQTEFDVNTINYRPSFLKLQNFESGRVHKFMR